MKNLAVLFIIVAICTSCYEDHSDLIPGQDFIPEEILEEIKANGQPIFEGLNPPDISGRYQVSPQILVSSNFEDPLDPGFVFANKFIEFRNLDRSTLKLEVDIEEADNEGTGFGSFISGEGNNFTVFVRIDRTDSDDHTLLSAEVISGTLTENGIVNLHNSLFMIEDNGDPNNRYIENGHGRLLRDQDGFSEKIR
ncbi:MAG: hypothetical protein AAF944_03180 [Bacteroidota bacterium]